MAAPRAPSRARHYCITDFTTKNYKVWKTRPLPPQVRNLTYQLELTADTNRLHIQGYIELYNKHSLKQLKEILQSPSLHVEQRQGSRKDARNYCLKDDSPWYLLNYPQWSEHGARVPDTTPVCLGTWTTQQGARTDLIKVYDLIYSGVSEFDILDQCPIEYLKYSTGIRRARHVRTLHLAGKYHEVSVEVLYGPSRSGKTRHVMSLGPGNIYKPIWNGSKYWFTDYDQQSVLLIDEFYGQMRTNELQELLDNYHKRLEGKGTNPISNWTKVYITSNIHPERWYKSWENIPHEVEQSIINRIDKVTYFPHNEKVTRKTWDSITL